MYAIIEIAGQQFKVQKDDEIFVHRLDADPGKKMEFSEVLLIDNDGKVSVGKPFVEGSMITAKVLEHVRGDKVVVFHKKRRKGYQKSTGHRQDFTRIQIDSIVPSGAKKKSVKKEEAPAAKKAAPVKKETTAKKATTAKKETPAKKDTPVKKETVAKKEPAKKAAPKKAAPKKATVKKETKATEKKESKPEDK